MADFQVHLTRYSKETARRLNSAPLFMKAQDMEEAVRLTGLFIDGMKSGGCTDDVQILAIQMQGVRGEQCHDSGAYIWETDEEREVRFGLDKGEAA